MPKYSYVAMDQKGKETKGTLEVASQNEAITRVKEMGFFPTKIVELEKEAAPTAASDVSARVAELRRRLAEGTEDSDTVQ